LSEIDQLSAHYRADSPATRTATRLCFFAAGFAVALWAPLVPYAKERLGIDNGQLGLIILCLGLGSVLAMPLTGGLANFWGSRRMILLSGAGLVLTLPLLALISSPILFASTLALFGASLGTLDVAMNMHGSEVERDADVPLMSGFHGLFSVGGFVGAAAETLALSSGATPIATALLGAAVVALLVLIARGGLLPTRAATLGQVLVAPRGIVLVIAALCAILFLVEGAVLDWGAVLLSETKAFAKGQAGIGYVLFAIAMTVGRLTGDRIVAELGTRRTLLLGGTLTVMGFLISALAPGTMSLVGFALTGVGASNLVPILFSAAGKQRDMPAGSAVAAIATAGYAGHLLGPAGIGAVAHLSNLAVSFVLLALLVIAVPACSGAIAKIST